MASISRGKNGHKTIQFIGADSKRRSIRLGKSSIRQAESVKVHVERLVTASISGHAVDDETTRWLVDRDDALKDKLSRVGLIQGQAVSTLEAFLDEYVVSRTDLKPRTIAKLLTTEKSLVGFLGSTISLRDVSPGDADDWRRSLLKAGLSENTVRKHASIAKQFFTAAIRKRLIFSNPFADLKSTIRPNPSRFYFVTRDEADAVLDACPDAQWRLLFALSRYGGLRCPSEHLLLRWGDIDWEKGRIRVHSPKTEHHLGGDSRVIPLFPQLRTPLEECFELAEPGDEYVITRYRNTNVNLRTQLLRIIERAGLQPWPKLFQNLRSTRQTELEETFPSHVVCAWIGNTRAIAAKHYLQVTDGHFEKAVQKAVQQTAVPPRTESQPKPGAHEKPLVLQGVATECENSRLAEVAEEGLEPPTRGL